MLSFLNTRRPKAFQQNKTLLRERFKQQLQNILLVIHIKAYKFNIWIILQHPQLPKVNMLWNDIVNDPFLLICPQFIITPYRVEWNKIKDPHLQC
jgi:hypothetical protein